MDLFCFFKKYRYGKDPEVTQCTSRSHEITVSRRTASKAWFLLGDSIVLTILRHIKEI
jgi:hypothetical protein